MRPVQRGCGMGFMGGCCGIFFGLFVALLIGSTFVRAAVSFANRVLGPAEPPDPFGNWDDWDSDEPAPRRKKEKSPKLIPEPTMTNGMLIALVSGVFNILVVAVLAVVTERLTDLEPNTRHPEAVLVLVALALPVTGLLFAVELMPLLPTTFRRALLVALLHHLLVLVIGGGLGIGTYLLVGSWGW